MPGNVSTKATATATAKPSNVILRCDICWKKSSSHETPATRSPLRTCNTCGVSFHNKCYGIEGRLVEDPSRTITCWACQAVGTTIKGRDAQGKTSEIVVRERPTECMLCGTDDKNDFLHAMHPIYDYHGRYGRHFILPATKKLPRRLAWAHTLCCSFVNSYTRTQGCVYGCTRDGGYEGGDEADDDDDGGGSVNSQMVLFDVQDLSIHHFVLVMEHKYEERNDWLRALHNMRRLKCIVCGKQNGSYRIPLQCVANDDQEHFEFQGTHKELGEPCCQAMHVGCAMWGRDNHDTTEPAWPALRRIYYHPGGSIKEEKVVVCIYCNVHAQDLVRHSAAGSQRRFFPGLETTLISQESVFEMRKSPRRNVQRAPENGRETTSSKSTGRAKKQVASHSTNGATQAKSYSRPRTRASSRRKTPQVATTGHRQKRRLSSVTTSVDSRTEAQTTARNGRIKPISSSRKIDEDDESDVEYEMDYGEENSAETPSDWLSLLRARYDPNSWTLEWETLERDPMISKTEKKAR